MTSPCPCRDRPHSERLTVVHLGAQVHFSSNHLLQLTRPSFLDAFLLGKLVTFLSLSLPFSMSLCLVVLALSRPGPPLAPSALPGPGRVGCGALDVVDLDQARVVADEHPGVRARGRQGRGVDEEGVVDRRGGRGWQRLVAPARDNGHRLARRPRWRAERGSAAHRARRG